MQTGSRRDPAFTGWPRVPLVVVGRRSYGSGGGMKLMQACSGSLVRDRLSGIACPGSPVMWARSSSVRPGAVRFGFGGQAGRVGFGFEFGGQAKRGRIRVRV